MRNRSLVRVLKLLHKLEQGGRWTLHDLAAVFGCCQRTIRRDLNALEEAGIPIAHEDGNGGYGEGGYYWWIVRR